MISAAKIRTPKLSAISWLSLSTFTSNARITAYLLTAEERNYLSHLQILTLNRFLRQMSLCRRRWRTACHAPTWSTPSSRPFYEPDRCWYQRTAGTHKNNYKHQPISLVLVFKVFWNWSTDTVTSVYHRVDTQNINRGKQDRKQAGRTWMNRSDQQTKLFYFPFSQPN